MGWDSKHLPMFFSCQHDVGNALYHHPLYASEKRIPIKNGGYQYLVIVIARSDSSG